MSEVMNDELPEGWSAVRLQDVASWGSGGTPSRANPTYFGGEIPWIKTGELDSGLILQTEEHLTNEGLKNSSAKIFPRGAVAVAMYGATIGKASILGIDAATNQACAVAIPDERAITSQYLFHFLRSQKEAFIRAGKGGAQPNISQGLIKEWLLPIAPLAEQKRIAEKLEALLGRVDACRARLDRVPDLLKRFRQSVLAAATSGRLTEDWRSTKTNPESWLHSVRKHAVTLPPGCKRLSKQSFKPTVIEHDAVELPTTWSVHTVGGLYDLKVLVDFADGNHGGLYPRKEEFGADGALFLTATQMNDRWTVALDQCPRLNWSKAKKLVKGWAQNSDVLLSHNATVGRVGMIEGLSEDVLLGTSVTFYRFNQHYILPHYARIVFSSRFFQDQLQSCMEQTTRDQVPITKQVSLNFICPPLSEQQEIVRRVEALFAFADRIEARLRAARAQVERLTPATLAKAFSGELVPQDPSDEPASALLERVRAGGSTQTKSKKAKSKS